MSANHINRTNIDDIDREAPAARSSNTTTPATPMDPGVTAAAPGANCGDVSASAGYAGTPVGLTPDAGVPNAHVGDAMSRRDRGGATDGEGDGSFDLDRIVADLGRRDDVARAIGEALRLAGVIEAVGIDRIVGGTPCEYDLGVRLNDLTQHLALFAHEGDATASMVHDRLAPLVHRMEAAAMNAAIGQLGGLATGACRNGGRPTGSGRSV